jgi:hypothetical protein
MTAMSLLALFIAMATCALLPSDVHAQSYTIPGAALYTNTQTTTGNAVAATPLTGVPRILGTFASDDEAVTANDPVRCVLQPPCLCTATS